MNNITSEEFEKIKNDNNLSEEAVEILKNWGKYDRLILYLAEEDTKRESITLNETLLRNNYSVTG